MGQPIWRNPLLLMILGISSLFVGAAFVYMSAKSPFFWGDLFVPGVALLLVFAMTAVLSIFSLLKGPVRASG